MVAYFCTPALTGLRQEDGEFEVSLVRPCLKKQNKNWLQNKNSLVVSGSKERTPPATVGKQTQIFQKKPAS